MAMENKIKKQKLKIILLGDSGVGKTSLINQYVCKKFQNKPILDFKDPLSKELEVNSKHLILQIYDTGGREREGAGLEAAFFSDAKGCMLVYDVNNLKSLESLENWHNEFITRVISNRASSRTFPFIVLGNKADTDGGRNKEVHEMARKWCESKGITHFLTSAKDNKSVAEAFLHVAQLALSRNTQEPIMETPNIPLPVPLLAPLGPPSQNGVKIEPKPSPINKPPLYNNDIIPQPPQYNSPINQPPIYNNGVPQPTTKPTNNGRPKNDPPPIKKSCCTIL